jgi:hypothetical protein
MLHKRPTLHLFWAAQRRNPWWDEVWAFCLPCSVCRLSVCPSSLRQNLCPETKRKSHKRSCGAQLKSARRGTSSGVLRSLASLRKSKGFCEENERGIEVRRDFKTWQSELKTADKARTLHNATSGRIGGTKICTNIYKPTSQTYATRLTFNLPCLFFPRLA